MRGRDAALIGRRDDLGFFREYMFGDAPSPPPGRDDFDEDLDAEVGTRDEHRCALPPCAENNEASALDRDALITGGSTDERHTTPCPQVVARPTFAQPSYGTMHDELWQGCAIEFLKFQAK